MANYKNRKPKSYKGHCGMCCMRDTNGRKLTRQELRFLISAQEQLDGLSRIRGNKLGW